MENLLIEHKEQRIVYWIFGGALILYAIISLIEGRGSLEKTDWIRSILFTVFGLLFFTPIIGTDKTQIDIGIGFLDIKWPAKNKIRILESEIDRITLSTNYIFIFRKDKKAIKLMLYSKKQKKQVYEFLNEYTHKNNLPLANQDEQTS